MTIEQAEAILTEEQIEQARRIGKEWGYAEADLWRDQNPEKGLPEWSMGTYCGDLPDSGEIKEAYELVLDCAARDEWRKIQEIEATKPEFESYCNNADRVLSVEYSDSDQSVTVEYSDGECVRYENALTALREMTRPTL